MLEANTSRTNGVRILRIVKKKESCEGFKTVPPPKPTVFAYECILIIIIRTVFSRAGKIRRIEEGKIRHIGGHIACVIVDVHFVPCVSSLVHVFFITIYHGGICYSPPQLRQPHLNSPVMGHIIYFSF